MSRLLVMARHVRRTDEAAKATIGRVIERTRTLAQLTLKEFAARIDRDPRQVARWIAAEERPHLDAIFADVELRPLFVIALAAAAGDDVEVESIVRLPIDAGIEEIRVRHFARTLAEKKGG